MVVLAHGRIIDPATSRDEMRGARGAPCFRCRSPGAREPARARDLSPELEFVFRTLVDLRVDMDELRREFEAYRRETALVVPDRSWGRLAAWEVPAGSWSPVGAQSEGRASRGPSAEELVGGDFADADPDRSGDGVVVFRPGTTMEDLERDAIMAALEAVSGNRRKAAEMLGIGERTLYRKITRFGL